MMWRVAALLLLMGSLAFGEGTGIYSHADLVRGVSLDCFWDFYRSAPDFDGDGEVGGGALHLTAPWGGNWAFAAPRWAGGARFVVEWEARRAAGPPEAEHGFYLPDQAGDEGVLVRFSLEGRVLVDRITGAHTESIAGPVPAPRIHSGGWDRFAVRVDGRRLAVLVGGEQVLAAALPADPKGSIAFGCAPGAGFDVDHVALYRSGVRPPERDSGAALRAFYFDSFTVGREEWSKNAFPVRGGVLHVPPSEPGDPDAGEFDLLNVPLPERCLVALGFRGIGTAEFLFHVRPGDDPSPFVRVVPNGGIRLVRRGGAGDRSTLLAPWRDPLPPDGTNRVLFTSGQGRFEVTVNDSMRGAWTGDSSGMTHFGVRSTAGIGFGLDDVVMASPPSPAPIDTAAASSLWQEIDALRADGDHAATADRLRNLFILAPGLTGTLDLFFREAALAGDGDAARTAGEAIRIGARPGGDEEKMRVVGLLLAGRIEEARGALARFRAVRPDDPFGLENTLLLLDRAGEYERVIREYEAARAGGEPIRAAGHGVAAWAYLRTATPERAADVLQLAARQGPGRDDLDLVEGDLLRARGDMIGALARYEAILGAADTPVPRENVRARVALLRFEMGDYATSARDLGALPATGDSLVDQARALVRGAALFQAGRARDEEGRADLAEARAIAAGRLGDPPSRGDAVISDLLGRIDMALALLDLQAGDSYALYRAKSKRALRNFEDAARLDPSYRTATVAEGTVPDLDPGRYRFLVRAALPDDHPVGGFVENVSRWPSWSLVDRRADLAEAEIGRTLRGRNR